MLGDKCGGGYIGLWDIQALGDQHACPKCTRGDESSKIETPKGSVYELGSSSSVTELTRSKNH